MTPAASRLSTYNQDNLRFQERPWIFAFAGPWVKVRTSRTLLILPRK